MTVLGKQRQLFELTYLTMLSKDDIKKLAKRIVHQQQGRRTHQIMHPERDWLIGVGLAVVIVMSSAVWSGSRYVETRDIISYGVTAEAEDAAVYRESHVKTALEIAGTRMYLDENSAAPQYVDTDVATSTATSTATTSESVTDTEESIEFDATTATSSLRPIPEPLDEPIRFE